MTTRRLLLIRHAKAEAEGEVDVERPLAKRGRADAAAIGRWLAEHDLIPDRVVVSPAIRARQTWQLAAESTGSAGPAGATAEPVLDERIYHNTVDELRQVMAGTPPGVGILAIIGHNPSIEDLAAALDDGSGDAAVRERLAKGYSTSGVTVFAVDPDWGALTAGTATLIEFAVPRG